MSHFNLENEFNSAMCLDGPISKGPMMRWQRKLNESTANTSLTAANGSLLQQMSCSVCTTTSSSSSTSGHLRRSLSTSNIQNISMRAQGTTPSRSRSRTPGRKSNSRTPTSASQGAGGDRFIPNRAASDFDMAQFKVHNKILSDEDETSPNKEEFSKIMNENLNGEQINAKILAFKQRAPSAPQGFMNSLRILYSQSKTPATAKKSTRHIAQVPERILDAPDLLDDYYLNLLDWSSSNLLAVALGSRLYVWNAGSGEISQLMEVDEPDYISSVSWVKEGSFLAVGISTGDVQIWDASGEKRLRSMVGHESRVGSLAWSNHLLTSGSRTGMIHHHDVRVAQHHIGLSHGHTQEVCGLEWSPDGKFLASGGNDNLLNIWSNAFTLEGAPAQYSFTQHQAAVKALSWCPWQPSLLASGGGTADRCIKFWNCNTGVCLNSVDTKSQVCSLLWSKEHKELISSHGFPNHLLSIWKYPTMKKVADLSGHTARVLHTSLSPDGSTVVSGAADETLRLWKCFAIDPVKAKKAVLSKTPAGPLHRSIR